MISVITLIGNEVRPGEWYADIPEELINEDCYFEICKHTEAKNKDKCPKCWAVFNWQLGRWEKQNLNKNCKKGGNYGEM